MHVSLLVIVLHRPPVPQQLIVMAEEFAPLSDFLGYCLGKDLIIIASRVIIATSLKLTT